MKNRIKVLYVDDEPMNLKLFVLSFSKAFEVLTANSALEGLEILNKVPEIKVVISDLHMPQMNGMEFIYKAREKFLDKSYFILTGFDITKEVQKALQEKVILKYFMKPFNKKFIESTINKLSL